MTYTATNEDDSTEEYLEVRILPASLRPTAVISGQDEGGVLGYPFKLDADASLLPSNDGDPGYAWQQIEGPAGEDASFTVDVTDLDHDDTVEVVLTVFDSNDLHGLLPSDPVQETLTLDFHPVFTSSLPSGAVLDEIVSVSVDVAFPDSPGIAYSWELGDDVVGTDSELELDREEFAIGDEVTLTVTVSNGGLDRVEEHSLTIEPTPLENQVTQAGSLVAGDTGVSYTFGFDLSETWPAEGTFSAVFPQGFSSQNPSASLDGCDGSASVADAAGGTIVVARSGDDPCEAGTSVELTLNGITNRETPGSTGSFHALLSGDSGNPLMVGAFPSVSLTAPETEEEEEDDDAPDPLRPDRVTDLAVVSGETSEDSVTLRWTAPVAQGEPLASYRIGASKNMITASNFAQVVTTQVSFDPDTFAVVGQTQRAVVSGLDAGTTYHFAVQAEDEAGNRSLVSNVVTTETEASFDPVQANKDLQATVSVRSSDGGMEVSWDSEKVPEIAAGIIVWRINSPATFAGVVEPEDPAFLDARFVDPEGNRNSGYLLTLYYGPQQDQGYNTESLAQIASSLGTTEDDMVSEWGVARAQATDSSSGFPIWILSLLALVLLAAAAAVLFVFVRRQKELEAKPDRISDADDGSYAEENADGMAWAAQPLAHGDEASHEAEGWTHDEDSPPAARAGPSSMEADDWFPEDETKSTGADHDDLGSISEGGEPWPDLAHDDDAVWDDIDPEWSEGTEGPQEPHKV